MPERRRNPRKKFNYYMRVINEETGEPIGHLADVSVDGMQLETSACLSNGQGFQMQMELTPDISDSLFLFIAARALWCNQDKIMPNLYHVGFIITSISDHDKEIYLRLIEKYGV